MKKLLILGFAIVSISSVPAHAAFACSPAISWPPSAPNNVAQKDIAFIGTVKSVTQDATDTMPYHVAFSVNKAIKGALADTVTVLTQSSSAACGYDDGATSFKAGKVWTIFGLGDSTKGYTTNSLSLNASYDSVAAAEAALAASGVTSTSTGTTGTSTTMMTSPAGIVRPTSSVDLMLGSRGENVTWLQQQLITLNEGTAAQALASAGATGYFGTMTRAALAEYQTAHAILPAAGYFGPKTRAAMAASTGTGDMPDDVVANTFTGKIEVVDIGCFADATCSVTVSGKKIVLATGMRVGNIPLPSGTLNGVDSIGDLQKNIGHTVRVYAQTLKKEDASDPDYTIIGSSNYYVELVGSVPANGPIVMKGTRTCLPPSDPNRPHIMLCALGLKGTDGNYYALRDSGMTDSAAMSTDGIVEVTGTFTAGQQGGTFTSLGTIDVAKISTD